MDKAVLEEQLREASCDGDSEKVQSLISRGVDLNSQHKINGWSALHWASKRGHFQVVAMLLSQGANKELLTNKNEKPSDLTTNPQILEMLGEDPEAGKTVKSSSDTLAFVPNYLQHPKFPYVDIKNNEMPVTNMKNSSNIPPIPEENELVLKARVANTMETDFIEIELDMNMRTYNNLLLLMCQELSVDQNLVQKIRKLPNTIVRKDKDVLRLKDFQEMELVLTSRAMSSMTRNYTGVQSNSFTAEPFKQSVPPTPAASKETILY